MPRQRSAGSRWRAGFQSTTCRSGRLLRPPQTLPRRWPLPDGVGSGCEAARRRRRHPRGCQPAHSTQARSAHARFRWILTAAEGGAASGARGGAEICAALSRAGVGGQARSADGAPRDSSGPRCSTWLASLPKWGTVLWWREPRGEQILQPEFSRSEVWLRVRDREAGGAGDSTARPAVICLAEFVNL